MQRGEGVNFFRTWFVDDANRRMVEACARGDHDFVARAIETQDGAHPALHADERYENRVGMQMIRNRLAAGPRRRVLDVACGNAELLRRLAIDGHDVAGCDVSPVRIANNRRDVPRLERGFVEQLPFADAAFDVVIAQECLEHVMDLDRSLHEIRRVLVPGGLFFCQVPFKTFADGCNHVRLFDADILRWCVESIGFRVLELEAIPYLVGEPPLNLSLIAEKPLALKIG